MKFYILQAQDGYYYKAESYSGFDYTYDSKRAAHWKDESVALESCIDLNARYSTVFKIVEIEYK